MKKNSTPNDNQKNNQSNQNEDNIVIIDDIIESQNEDLNAKLQIERQTNAQLKDNLRSFKAEFDNYKRRSELNILSAKNEGEFSVIEKLLPLADALESALNLITDKSVIKGIELITKQLNDIFNQFEVKKIEALNQEFNPQFHNAVLTKPDSENSGKIIEVIKNGYISKDKVLRYAFVVVAS